MSDLNNTIDHQYYTLIIEYLHGFRNDTADFTKPYMKTYFTNSWPLVAAIYGLLILFSLIANFSMIYYLLKNNFHEKFGCAFFINIAIANILHVTVPLPITIINILLHNWIFGKFMCYFLPVLQDIPTHVLMMSYLLIFVDRYRYLSRPRKSPMPTFVCSVGTWLCAMCIALLHPIYPTYLDLQSAVEEKGFKNTGDIKYPSLCVANLENDVHDYMKSLFIGTYVAPLAINMYFFVKSSREIENQERPLSLTFTTRNIEISAETTSKEESICSNDVAESISMQKESENLSTDGTATHLPLSYDVDESEYDVQVETRTQKYFFIMLTVFAACLIPLMILRLAKSSLSETYDNMHHVDVVYLTFIWLAFLPSITTPCIYFIWKMSK